MKTFKPLSITLAILALTGCAATDQAHKTIDKEKADMGVRYQGVQQKASGAAIAENDANKMTNFSRSNRNWVNTNPLEKDTSPILPDFFNKKVQLTMPGTVNAVEIVSELQRATALRFNISQDIYNINKGIGKIIDASSNSSEAKKISPLNVSDFVYSGSLKDALDMLSAKANISWKWTGNAIEIFRYETKTYNIAALAGVTDVNSSVSLQGDTGGSAASTSTGTSSNTGKTKAGVDRRASLTTWGEIKSFLIAQMSGEGTIAVLESSGTVTVTDLPTVHARMTKTIDSLNTLLTKQIYLNVDVYSVADSSGDNIGIDWNLLWSGNIDGGASKLGLASSLTKVSSTPSFSAGVLSGPFNGTSVVLNALSSLGKTSLVNQFSVTTLNGQPAPIASNQRQGYLQKVTVTAATSTSGATTELIPGELISGINLNVLPKIEPNGDIILEYVLNLSDSKVSRTFSSGGQTIEIPTSDSKSVSNRAILKSGQTLVLSGFKQQKNSVNNSGVGSPTNILLGGNVVSANDDQYLVVTVTPYIAQNNSRK